ncbi:MAG TPA: flagellar basal body P-ring formation chaperone FlgA [Candidatus Elarobacter sp.]|jgi:flagella basal body P-ring formation protein FlgA|nr:flagellar basal body P-ring formation chaperone FlgA [Candidatus Elarobacter sp.]
MFARRALALLTTTLIGALCAPVGVSASAETQVVAGARVAAVADKIAHELVTGPDRSVAAAYQVSDQNLPAGAVQIAPAGTPFVSTTYVSVPVAIRIDGKLARTVVAGYRITTYVRTAVAARDLTPGAVLAADDLALARVASNGRPAVGTDALIGRKLNSATAKGAPLYVEQTVPDTVVKAGQAAVLMVRDGNVALTVDVVARTGGAIGDTVTVFNPQTQRAIAAVVTGKNRVELILPGGER